MFQDRRRRFTSDDLAEEAVFDESAGRGVSLRVLGQP